MAAAPHDVQLFLAKTAAFLGDQFSSMISSTIHFMFYINKFDFCQRISESVDCRDHKSPIIEDKVSWGFSYLIRYKAELQKEDRMGEGRETNLQSAAEHQTRALISRLTIQWSNVTVAEPFEHPNGGEFTFQVS